MTRYFSYMGRYIDTDTPVTIKVLCDDYYESRKKVFNLGSYLGIKDFQICGFRSEL